ncbi:hypothetical protein A2U01_0042814, partial [Trifolium medium]|nr:hypothetical protein [Trifolium medium]
MIRNSKYEIMLFNLTEFQFNAFIVDTVFNSSSPLNRPTRKETLVRTCTIFASLVKLDLECCLIQ